MVSTRVRVTLILVYLCAAGLCIPTTFIGARRFYGWLLISTNYGVNFTTMCAKPEGPLFASGSTIKMFSPTKGIAVGGPSQTTMYNIDCTYRNATGCCTWTMTNPDYSFCTSSWGLAYESSFINETHGYAIGNRCYKYRPWGLFKTTNGGRTWNQVLDVEPNTISRIKFKDWQNGTMVTPKGIEVTSDGGKTWRVEWSANLEHGEFGHTPFTWQWVNDDVAYACATSDLLSSPKSVALFTTDAGRTWTQMQPLPNNTQKCIGIGFANKTRGFLVMYDSYYTTSDSGNTWKEATWPWLRFIVVNPSFFFYNSTFGMLSDVAGFHSTPKYTHDGGKTWHDSTFPGGAGGYISSGMVQFSDKPLYNTYDYSQHADKALYEEELSSYL